MGSGAQVGRGLVGVWGQLPEGGKGEFSGQLWVGGSGRRAGFPATACVLRTDGAGPEGELGRAVVCLSPQEMVVRVSFTQRGDKLLPA